MIVTQSVEKIMSNLPNGDGLLISRCKNCDGTCIRLNHGQGSGEV